MINFGQEPGKEGRGGGASKPVYTEGLGLSLVNWQSLMQAIMGMVRVNAARLTGLPSKQTPSQVCNGSTGESGVVRNRPLMGFAWNWWDSLAFLIFTRFGPIA